MAGKGNRKAGSAGAVPGGATAPQTGASAALQATGDESLAFQRQVQPLIVERSRLVKEANQLSGQGNLSGIQRQRLNALNDRITGLGNDVNDIRRKSGRQPIKWPN